MTTVEAITKALEKEKDPELRKPLPELGMNESLRSAVSRESLLRLQLSWFLGSGGLPPLGNLWREDAKSNTTRTRRSKQSGLSMA